ncbi:hypothetical protein GO613_13900 [Azoarcus communis]|uniref:zonular occludens toxin domain-containing protein n=1 Tax=Parazoarcus communis TaxID=41977 RepID=UPI0014594A4D|nr:zonular occludens toxin domain-containing protein [Parazoarcus communis]NMG49197.1 hypothetical protein [Parazoarcus communis]
MAEAILISGKRGEGKSVAAARMMSQYIRRGCPVATNMDIKMEGMARPWSKLVCYRLPDHPTAADLDALPLGNPNPLNEPNNGLLVLDEVATFLNSRNWQEKARAAVISWLLHSRKKGWDLLLIAQHPRLVDAQIRDSLCELSATARRADKLVVPLIGPAWKSITGKPMKLPKAHVVTFRYGFGPNAPKTDIWWFNGSEFHNCYDSLQQITGEGQQAVSSFLPAWHLKGRYMSKIEMYRGVGIAAFVVGAVVGGLGGYFTGASSGQAAESSATLELERTTPEPGVVVQGVLSDGANQTAILSDGRMGVVQAVRDSLDGRQYRVFGKWYAGGR